MPPPPLVVEVSGVMYRAAVGLLVGEEWFTAAEEVLALPEIAEALRDSRKLSRIRTVHLPHRWGDSDIVVCEECHQAYPCTTAQIAERTDG